MTAAASAAGLLTLTVAHQTGALDGVDRSSRAALLAATPAEAAPWATVISTATSMFAVAGLAVVTAVALLLARRPRADVAVVLLTPLVTVFTAGLLKVVVGRERPVAGDGFAYPSGHATNVVALTVVIAFLVFAATSAAGILIRAAAVLGVTLVVGWARLSSGEHWPSDVIGGTILGLSLSALLLLTCAHIHLPRPRATSPAGSEDLPRHPGSPSQE